MNNVIYLTSFGILNGRNQGLVTTSMLMDFDDILDIYHVCITLHDIGDQQHMKSNK